MMLRTTSLATTVMALLLSTWAGVVQAQPQYSVTLIKPVPGDSGSIAHGINNATEVVGWSVGTGIEHAYFWENGGTVALPAFNDGGLISSAYGINNAGLVVGESTGSGVPQLAALWTRNDDSVWQVENLGTLGGYYFSRALDISDPGNIIAGFVDDAIVSHAAVWEYNGAVDPPWAITDLGLLPGHIAAEANGVNSSGTVAGYSGGPAGTVALVWQKDSDGNWLRTQLPALPGGRSAFATGINEFDQIVGTAGALDGLSHAVVWLPDTSHDPPIWTIIDLGAFEDEWTYGLAINGSGQVVGETRAPGVGIVRAILIDDGVMYDLNDLIPAGTPLDLKSAQGINDGGHIVGRADDTAGYIQSFLLTPAGDG